MLLDPWMHGLTESVALGTNDLKVHFIGTHCVEHYMALEEDTKARKR